MFLSLLESSIIILLSILFPGITSPILSAIYTIGFFLIGHSSEILRTLIDETPSLVSKYILMGTYYLLPNLEKFNTRNDVIYDKIPSFYAIILTIIYALCCASTLFLLAKINLKRKEF